MSLKSPFIVPVYKIVGFFFFNKLVFVSVLEINFPLFEPLFQHFWCKYISVKQEPYLATPQAEPNTYAPHTVFAAEVINVS